MSSRVTDTQFHQSTYRKQPRLEIHTFPHINTWTWVTLKSLAHKLNLSSDEVIRRYGEYFQNRTYPELLDWTNGADLYVDHKEDLLQIAPHVIHVRFESAKLVLDAHKNGS